MARKSRKVGDTGIYHLILRGNDRQNIFYDDDDRLFFINRIKKYSRETDIKIYAYCLMNNHVHFLIGNGNPQMALFVKKITCSYVYKFNRKYNRIGHLFQGRYKSEPIETVEYFKTVYRYILQNPEKANICSFQNYKWGSIWEETKTGIVDIDYVNNIFCTESERKSFLQIKNSDTCMQSFPIEKRSFNDDELKILFIKQIFKIENILSIRDDDMVLKIMKLRTLKKFGIPINQIARITGISRKIIQMA